MVLLQLTDLLLILILLMLLCCVSRLWSWRGCSWQTCTSSSSYRCDSVVWADGGRGAAAAGRPAPHPHPTDVIVLCEQVVVVVLLQLADLLLILILLLLLLLLLLLMMPHHHRLNQLWSLQQSTTAVSILVAEVDWWSCNQSRTDNCRALPSSCRCRPCRHCISVTGGYTVTLRWTLKKHSKTRQCGSFSCLIQYIQYIQQLCYATLLVVWLSLVAS